MKKSIRDDRKREVFSSEYLNDNALLELRFVENRDVAYCIRYVDAKEKSIKEDFLTQMSIYDYVSERADLVKVSEDASTIAIFKKVEEGFQLAKIYDTKKHEFAMEEFMDIEYEKKFPKHPLNKQFILQNNSNKI